MSTGKIKAEQNQVHVIAERCKGCAFCVEFCPNHVLYQTNETNSKGYYLVAMNDSGKCSGCEMCTMVCPEFAIYVETTEEDS